ncbi:terminase TerL endonuclease subunit [Actinoallomurus iriomotensis]|uniref:Terminase n=1 Tax=Actinoallomurus iriomotensis TaxID=478107 RepID=A0A9W6VR54_9ACTN|nr:terminase TerL endonuclease subunit [Actinoallomurus iriomotensis]GLY81848.1 hypothetical protein Airi01_101150 [Actinoallomurus iriomotensis]
MTTRASTTPSRGKSSPTTARPLSAPRSLGWPSYGRIVCAWIEKNCVYGDGDYFGQPVRLQRWQRQFIYWLYEYNPVTGERRFRRALLEISKGNGKTPMSGWIMLFELLGPPLFGPKGSPIIPVAAASFEQADLLFGDMRDACRESPTLKQFTEAYDTEILVKGGPGRAYRVAAVAGTNDGQRPSLFAADEIHEWTGNKERVHLVIANGLSKRRNSLVLNTTTAGSDLESLAGRMHLDGYRVNAGEIDDDEFLFVHYGAAEIYDLDDEEQLLAAILAANPAAGTFLHTTDVLARARQIPRFEFERYHLGRWTRAEECWLPPGAWEGCAGVVDLDPMLPAYAAVDMALKHDHVAVVIAQPQPDGRVAVSAKTWDPADSGGIVDTHAVENHLRQVHRDLNIRTIAYDPAYFQRSAEVLLDEGMPMAEFSQGAASMVPACQDAYRLITGGMVVHGDDPVLTDHVLAAAVRETDSGWRLSKGRSKRKIDAAIAMVMALFLSGVPVEEPAVPNLW